MKIEGEYVSEKGYDKGYVQCVDCRNLESYWKDGSVGFFMCRVKLLAMKQLKGRWRHCKYFIHSNEPPQERRNEVQ